MHVYLIECILECVAPLIEEITHLVNMTLLKQMLPSGIVWSWLLRNAHLTEFCLEFVAQLIEARISVRNVLLLLETVRGGIEWLQF